MKVIARKYLVLPTPDHEMRLCTIDVVKMVWNDYYVRFDGHSLPGVGPYKDMHFALIIAGNLHEGQGLGPDEILAMDAELRIILIEGKYHAVSNDNIVAFTAMTERDILLATGLRRGQGACPVGTEEDFAAIGLGRAQDAVPKKQFALTAW